MEYVQAFRQKYAYDDPLASLRPYVDQYIRPALTGTDGTVYGGKLVDNFHVIAFSVVLYSCLYHLAKIPLLNGRIRQPLKTQKSLIDFSMRSVSFIQATLICFLGIPIFGNEYLEEDHVLATTPYSSFYASMALGYFMWDAIVSLYFVNYFGIGFAIHGIVSVMVFAAGLAYGFIHYYSAAFLLFELSTPFLDLRWFGMTFGTTVFPEWFQLANNIALIVTFFLVRIVWGWYMFARLSIDLYATRLDPRFPILGALATVTSNISIDILNIYWFSKMASIGIATVRKWGVKEEKEKEI